MRDIAADRKRLKGSILGPLTLTDMVKHYIYRTEAAEAKVDIAAAELASIRCPADDDRTRRDVFNTCAKCTIYAPQGKRQKCWSDYLEQKAKEATK